jgi:hypothetical protein
MYDAGNGRKVTIPTRTYTGFVNATLGESPRRYDLLEGAGPDGGTWAAREVCGPNRELAIFDTRAEAVEHIGASQI